MNISIIKTYFEDNKKLDLESSLLLSGHLAGICYDKEGYERVKEEDRKKTERRIKLTKDGGHHSVYDHIYMTLNITGIPKILAMVLNNEKEYTTSEKSLRYTKVVPSSVISESEVALYQKWVDIFENKIKEEYKDNFTDTKITKLAQENARYLISVFIPTTMAYTVSLRQINYLASWMKKYIDNHDNNYFSNKLSEAMQEFILKLGDLNILDSGLMKNEKNRKISLFGSNINNKENYYGDVYATSYQASFAYFAEAQRYRTIDYKLELTNEDNFFVPPIIENDEKLKNDWLKDMQLVKNLIPQGQIVAIRERGTYENFILKCKERLCSAAQLEIMMKTKEILKEYYHYLEEHDNDLALDLANYLHGARCTFPDYECSEKCMFKEGVNLTRKI